MDNQKSHDDDVFAALPPTRDGVTESDTVVSTRAEWEANDELEVFGVRRIVSRAKKKTPGVKAALVFHDSPLRTRRRVKECTFVRPVIDLPEIVSAMIGICDANPITMEKVGKKMFERRAQQPAELQDGVRLGPSSEK